MEVARRVSWFYEGESDRDESPAAFRKQVIEVTDREVPSPALVSQPPFAASLPKTVPYLQTP